VDHSLRNAALAHFECTHVRGISLIEDIMKEKVKKNKMKGKKEMEE
jgi:hypothetical protein